ncbi:MAG: Gfo/Idh/MocA family protein, partial [Alphaproteobacteria bacterium]
MAASIRVAVAGAGYFARYHYEAWTRIKEANLVALVEPDGARSDKMARDFAVPRVFETLEALLAEVELDLLDIATPPETHHALVAQAAARGLAVVCQKPLAPSLDEARDIVALAEGAGIPLIVHENFRFQPWYRHAKALLEAGRLGRPHAVAFRLRPGDGQGPAAYLDRQPYFQQMPRFLIHETGIHFVDVFRFVLGEIAAVTAHLRRLNPAIAGEDAGIVIFEFESGASGLFDGNRLNDHVAANCRLTMGEMWLEGSDGVLRLDGDGRLWFKPHGGAEREELYPRQDRGFAGDCVHSLIRHVVDHLTRGAPVENTGRDYLRNIEIEDAIYRSHDTG